MKKILSFLLFVFCIVLTSQLQAQKKIVVLGSSTAAGGGATSMDSAWVGRLQAQFRKNTSDADTTIINLAVGGYVTYRIMPDNFVTPPNRPAVDVNVNVTKALTYNPDIIIISMPSNDIASGYSENEVMNNFRLLNQVITSQGVRAIFTTTQPRNDIDLLHRVQLRELNDSLISNFGSRAVNFYDDLVTQDGQYLLRDDRRTDNIHPNNTGHRFLFERVVAAQIFSGIQPTLSPIPGKIEAESFSSMSGIQTESTSDAGGGLNVGWQDNNDWMDYNVNVSAAGSYTVSFRVASQFNGAQFQLRKSDGTVLSTVTVPNTGGFQSWQTVNNTITLSSGQQTLRIITIQANGGWNINWMNFVQNVSNQPPLVSAGSPQTITLPVNSVTLTGSASDPDGSIASYLWTQVSGPSVANISNATSVSATMSSLVQGSYIFRLTATDNSGTSASGDVTVTVNAAVPPPSGNIKIEAENYSAMSGIQTEPTSDAGGGLNVGWQDNNDWMDYSVNVPSSGVFTVNFRVASMFSGAQFQLRKSDGTALATITVPNTGSFQSWQTVSVSANLSAGLQTLRITTIQANGGWNINWWEIAGGATPPPATNIKIEAENFSSMFGIQTEPTSDAGGGLNVAWQDNNDWMDYNVNLSSGGTYTASFRVASMFSGAQFQLRNSSGAVLATITVPNTGNFQSWQTVSASVTLPAGAQTLRIYTIVANGGWNINWWSLVSSGTTPPPGNIKIEAENFSSMSGIQTEPTSDAGGGLNVGWQDNNDWMDYSVNVATAGTYSINFRVASMFSGAQFQLRNNSGSVLATGTVPNTGSFQSWQTITVTATLPSGTQTLRIITTQANGGWNINWWEIVGAGTNASITRSGLQETPQTNVSRSLIYPNPFHDVLLVNINNTLQGKVFIELVDLSGRVIQQHSFTKTSGLPAVEKMNFHNLKHGMYVVRIRMDHWQTSEMVSAD